MIGDDLFRLMTTLWSSPPSEDILQGGPIQWGRIKINEFIVSKSGMAASPDTVPNNGVISPFTAFNDEVTFIVTFGGDATPQWTLVRVTANSTSPFLNAVRKRTQDVTVTMGPRGSNEVAAIYQASLTGQAVAAALQTRR